MARMLEWYSLIEFAELLVTITFASVVVFHFNIIGCSMLTKYFPGIRTHELIKKVKTLPFFDFTINFKTYSIKLSVKSLLLLSVIFILFFLN
jgi:hypothetical protein